MFKIEMKNEISIKENDYNILKIEYYKLIKYEVNVYFILDNLIIFYDEYFPIFEFIYQFENWKKNDFNGDFFYNSIETEDNPIIIIELFGNSYYFKSTWNGKKVKEKIDIFEFEKEIENCKKEIFN